MLIKKFRFARGLCVVLTDHHAAFSKIKKIFLPTKSFTCIGAPVLAQIEQQDRYNIWSGTFVQSNFALIDVGVLYLNVNVATSLSLEVIGPYEWGLLFERCSD